MRKFMSNFKRAKLTAQERLSFLDYLQNSLNNGFSLNASLEMMPILWPKQRKLLLQINQEIATGTKLSTEMLKIGFPKTVATQVDLAMQQGNLIECLSQLATLNRLKNEQFKKLKTELSYPLVLAVMMIFLLIFMQTFVSNQFKDSGEHTGDIVLLVLLSFSFVFLYYFIRTIKLLQRQDYSSLKLLVKYPFVGPIIQIYVKYILIYDLGLLLASGFSLQKMCIYAMEQTQGSLQEQIGRKVNQHLNEGWSIDEIVKHESFLPNEMLLLLQTGSKKSDLSKRFLLLGKTLFTDLTSKIEKLVVNVEPFCFILIGICIIGMYLKLLLPMYSMMQSI